MDQHCKKSDMQKNWSKCTRIQRTFKKLLQIDKIPKDIQKNLTKFIEIDKIPKGIQQNLSKLARFLLTLKKNKSSGPSPALVRP